MRILFILITLLFAPAIHARTVSEFFATAPDDVIRLIPQSTRLDMLDYFNYGSSRASENYFGGSSRVKALSDAVLDIQVDENVEMQFAVLPAKNDTMIAVVTTLYLPVADSSVKFYTSEWKPVNKPPFEMPSYDKWLTPAGVASVTDLKPYLPFMPVSASFNSDATVLSLFNNADEYLGEKQFEKFSPWIVPSMDYSVVSNRFSLKK